MVEILYASGLRISELVALPLAAVVHDPAFLMVRGKGGKDRLAPLNDAARTAIKAYLPVRGAFLGKSTKANPWLFASGARGGRLSARRFSQLLDEAAGVAGIDPARVSPHVLRHRVRHPSSRRRRRSAGRADSARPRRHRHHADLHPRHSGSAASGRGKQAPSVAKALTDRPRRPGKLQDPHFAASRMAPATSK